MKTEILICPVCKDATRFPVDHHDHLRDLCWDRDIRAQFMEVSPHGRRETFDDTVICDGCNNLCVQFKFLPRILKRVPKFFSLSPADMLLFKLGVNEKCIFERCSRRYTLLFESFIKQGIPRDVLEALWNKRHSGYQTKDNPYTIKIKPARKQVLNFLETCSSLQFWFIDQDVRNFYNEVFRESGGDEKVMHSAGFLYWTAHYRSPSMPDDFVYRFREGNVDEAYSYITKRKRQDDVPDVPHHYYRF